MPRSLDRGHEFGSHNPKAMDRSTRKNMPDQDQECWVSRRRAPLQPGMSSATRKQIMSGDIEHETPEASKEDLGPAHEKRTSRHLPPETSGLDYDKLTPSQHPSGSSMSAVQNPKLVNSQGQGYLGNIKKTFNSILGTAPNHLLLRRFPC
jgi:hypothetical protein